MLFVNWRVYDETDGIFFKRRAGAVGQLRGTYPGVVTWIFYEIQAALEDIRYLSVMICFVMFLVNDLYGFVSWKRMERRQQSGASKVPELFHNSGTFICNSIISAL